MTLIAADAGAFVKVSQVDIEREMLGKGVRDQYRIFLSVVSIHCSLSNVLNCWELFYKISDVMLMRGMQMVWVSKVRGHAMDFMVQQEQVCSHEKRSNDQADNAAGLVEAANGESVGSAAGLTPCRVAGGTPFNAATTLGGVPVAPQAKNGDGISGDGAMTQKPFARAPALEAFSSWKTLAW